MRTIVAVVVVWAIFFLVPFLAYGFSSVFFGLQAPPGPAWRFLLSVAITKIGTAVAFVALFAFSRDAWREHWLLYAAIWFSAFTISEIGDLVKTGYSVAEAMIGISSEAVYTPLSAFTLDRIFR